MPTPAVWVCTEVLGQSIKIEPISQNMVNKTYQVRGMHCTACATAIELDLEDAGIRASCSWAKQTLEVEDKTNKEEVQRVLKPLGYDLA